MNRLPIEAVDMRTAADAAAHQGLSSPRSRGWPPGAVVDRPFGTTDVMIVLPVGHALRALRPLLRRRCQPLRRLILAGLEHEAKITGEIHHHADAGAGRDGQQRPQRAGAPGWRRTPGWFAAIETGDTAR